MSIIIDDSIRQMMPGCRLGFSLIEDTVIKGTPAALTKEFLQLQAELDGAYDLDILPKLPRIIAVRKMYKKLHFDASRYRPASEALIRRVLQHKNIYYVNSAVDVNNYCSLKFLLPCGLYDADVLEDEVVYRLAAPGTYVNIAGHEISTEGKPFLTDRLGVFGNPTADARRAAVTLSTRRLLSVIYPDEEVEDDELGEMVAFIAEMLVRYNGGRIIRQQVIKA